jgi:hypothetical protein
MLKYNENNIKELLLRFSEGQTTEMEEEVLKDYFTHSDHIPEEWKAYKDLFSSFDTDAFDFPQEEVDAMFVAEPAKKRTIWPWIAAACAIGALIMFVTPPKSTEEPTEHALASAVVTKTPKAEEESVKTPPVQETAMSEKKRTKRISSQPKRSQQEIVEEEAEEEPVRMSEETRMEIILASLEEKVPISEEFDFEEDIRQLRQRGQQMMNAFAVRMN